MKRHAHSEHSVIPWYIIAYKLLYGLTELSFGLAIGFFGKPIHRIYARFIAEELSENPHDLLARMTAWVIPNILSHRTFLVSYLILLGGAKVAGAIGLMYKKNWGVDLIVSLTLLMFPFQMTGLILHPSVPDFLYIFAGLLIALYLIDFKPHAWISRVLRGNKNL